MRQYRQLAGWATARSQRAFTLVEALCAIGLVVLLAAVALPNLADTMERYRVRTAAWQVAGDLRLARAKAVSTRRLHRVCFDKCGAPVPADGYLIQRKEGSEWVIDSAVQAPSAGIRTTSNVNILFNESGEAFGGTVTLENGSSTLKVRTHYTGRVRLCMEVCS